MISTFLFLKEEKKNYARDKRIKQNFFSTLEPEESRPKKAEVKTIDFNFIP